MMRSSRWVVISVLVVLGLVGGPVIGGGSADAAAPGAPVNQTAPSISGEGRVGTVLTAAPGTWAPAATSYTFQWLRDGVAEGTPSSTPTRTLGQTDLGHTFVVRAVATNAAGPSDPADSPPTTVTAGRFTAGEVPRIAGVRRWGRTLTGSVGTTSPAPTSVTVRWLRDGRPIAGATKRTYALAVADYGHRIAFRVLLQRPGYAALTRTSPATGAIGHRVAVRKRFTYSITTRGRVTADLAAFARLAAQTYADPRGWRAAGYQFTRVARGGDFTLVLATAGSLPSFGSPCSATWSCRSGRYVVINQTRWLHASPAWNAQHLALRDYRHMVVDHETGHWLGHRHRGCTGKGRPAPVMMQQSKGLHGCRFNPFPLPSERWTSR
ncbi:DUF3152 domain-containing protein [Marmoricola sp. RAF53]|uniref:DUF3152 domain-containing protein n=1 Tax=Marmoricola sp. RAF53 TaxID=3233059 RepID=UPI003F98B044